MDYNSKEECIAGMIKAYQDFKSRLTAVTIGVRMVMNTIVGVIWAAWIVLGIFTLPPVGIVKLCWFILYTVIAVFFWFLYSYAKDGMITSSMNKVIDDIIDEHLSMWPEYREMQDWQQKDFKQHDIIPLFK